MLASPWFERALKKDGWVESNRNPEDGLFHVTTTNCDAGAFLLFLNVLHVRNGGVPRIVSLKMLAKTAVLVNYYECGEALELVQERWIIRLKGYKPVPSIYDRDLVLWTWVSWAFNLDDCFERATAVAIEQNEETLRTLELQIPGSVSGERVYLQQRPSTCTDSELDGINHIRYQAIESTMDQLHDLLDKCGNVEYKSRSKRLLVPMRFLSRGRTYQGAPAFVFNFATT
jgi:hypothetical protein